MKFEKKSHILLYIFFLFNEGRLEELEVSEIDMKNFFSEDLSDADLLHYIQQNIGDGLIFTELIFDDPDRNGTYYKLTKKGIDKVREIFNLEYEEEFPDELGQFQSLYLSFIASNLPKLEKEAYDSTIDEVIKSYKNRCLNAAVSLCGKLLEIYLTELLQRNNILIRWFQKGPKDTQGSYTEELTLGQLFSLAKNGLPDEVKAASLEENQIEIIKKYRNYVIHHNKSTINPSSETTMGIMQFTAHFLRHRLTWN